MGTFEFCSERILATSYDKNAKIRLRTGGSIGKISSRQCNKLEEGDGVYWDIHRNADDPKDEGVQLPVKYRYRSPVVFEFHTRGKRKADAYALVWLHHLIDNEETPINIPIWRCEKGPTAARVTQNYITEANCTNEIGLDDLKEVGRLQFRARFKAGMDESHEAFIQDNDSRETYETWEACVAEGVRTRKVDKEVSDLVQQLHEESLTEGRDVLKDASEDEKNRWLARDGTDWSGAFGHDPKAYVDWRGKKRREPGVDEPWRKDPYHPEDFEEGDHAGDDDSDEDDDSDADLGIQDADTHGHAGQMNGTKESNGSMEDGGNLARGKSMDTNRTTSTWASQLSKSSTVSSKEVNKQNKRTEERKQRGLMQWKPARNAKFAKNEAKIGLKKIKHRITGGLDGRQPGVETGKFSLSHVIRVLWFLTLSF